MNHRGGRSDSDVPFKAESVQPLILSTLAICEVTLPLGRVDDNGIDQFLCEDGEACTP